MTAPKTPNGVRAQIAELILTERTRIARRRAELLTELRQLGALDTDLTAAADGLGVLTRPDGHDDEEDRAGAPDPRHTGLVALPALHRASRA